MTPSRHDPFLEISDILARKAEGRRELAFLSFGEKIVRMESLRERLHPLKAARLASGRTRSHTDEAKGQGR